jgi:RNA polymerase sigma-70 factor, ECF subfamily
MDRDDEVELLVRRSQSGDHEAFAKLFRIHRESAARIVFRLLGPSPDADDVIQEVFLQVHRSLADFRGEAKFSTWLHRVTVNVVRMVQRAARSRPIFSGDGYPGDQPDTRLAPDQGIARQQRIEAFQRLLDRLSEKKRVVFILHEIEGISPSEIAEIVDAPLATIRTRLFNARRELESMMADEPALAELMVEMTAEENIHTGAAGEETESL